MVLLVNEFMHALIGAGAWALVWNIFLKRHFVIKQEMIFWENFLKKHF